jgi:hypothetical protein
MSHKTPKVFLRFIIFYHSKEVEEFRQWFIRNSRVIAFLPVLILTLSNFYNEDKSRITEERNKYLEEENVLLKQKSISVFRNFDDIPISMWSKLKMSGSFDFIMLRNNETFSINILKPLNLDNNYYIGKSDKEVFKDSNIWKKFQTEDSMVASDGHVMYTTNRVEDGVETTHDLLVVKWRKIEAGDTIVMGMAIEIEEIIEELRNNYGFKR